MGIVLFHEGVDSAGQLPDAGERAAADGLLIDLVDPGGIGGGVEQVVAGPA